MTSVYTLALRGEVAMYNELSVRFESEKLTSLHCWDHTHTQEYRPGEEGASSLQQALGVQRPWAAVVVPHQAAERRAQLHRVVTLGEQKVGPGLALAVKVILPGAVSGRELLAPAGALQAAERPRRGPLHQRRKGQQSRPVASVAFVRRKARPPEHLLRLSRGGGYVALLLAEGIVENPQAEWDLCSWELIEASAGRSRWLRGGKSGARGCGRAAQWQQRRRVWLR